MNLVEYAKSELSRLEKDGDDLQQLMSRHIIDIIEMFSKQGHSEFSANYAIRILERLLRWKPITPLTGADDEWELKCCDSDGISTYQNTRCFSVFKYVDSQGHLVSCHDIEAVTVSDNGGITWFSTKRFRKQVTFPYEPPTKPEKVYIECTEHVPIGFTGDKFDIITNDPERIKKLYERKRKEFEEAEKESD